METTVSCEVSYRNQQTKKNIDVDKPISYGLIDTHEYHNNGPVGGNLHCLIKQLLSKF